MGNIRYFDKDAIHFVSNRCEHEMFLLLPQKRINELIVFWLAKAMDRYGSGIRIYALIFMCNHFHILLQDTLGQLPQFMGYFQGNLARAINDEIGRGGSFWYREYDDVIVDGEEEFWNRYAYTVLNPVKSGLVATAGQWRGLSSLGFALENKPLKITGINRTKYNDAMRFGKRANPKDYEETYSFKVSTPPMLQGKTRARQNSFITELLKGAAQKYKKDRLYKPALGMRRVMKQRFTNRPKSPSQRPRFKFFCMDRERLKELKGSYNGFVARYRECMAMLFDRAQQTTRPNRRAPSYRNPIPWPPGCFPPTCHVPVTG